MTKSEIVKACNTAIGADGYGRVDILAIWAVINAHYELYHDYIEHYPSRHRLRKLQNDWKKEFQHFNHQLFIYLPMDLAVEMVEEIYDNYIRYVEIDIVRLRLAIMKQVNTDDLEIKQRFTHAYVCYELVMVAHAIFSKVFKETQPDSKKVGKKDKAKSLCLEKLENTVRLWFLEYMKGLGLDTPMRTKEIESEERELCRATVRWITKINKEIGSDEGVSLE